MANRGQRFPRGKYVRQLKRMQAELAAWRELYSQRARNSDSVFIRSYLEERGLTCDEWWHELQNVVDVIQQPMRWPA